MAWTTPRTWASGALTAADMNVDIRDNETWIKDALTLHGIDSATTRSGLKSAIVGCMAIFSAGGQTFSVGAYHSIDFSGTELWDSDAFHDPGVNPERITIPAGLGGYYQVTAQSYFSVPAGGSSTGYSRLIVCKNATDDASPSSANIVPGLFTAGYTSSADSFGISIGGPALLAVGDYITANMAKSAGAGNVTINKAAFSITRLAAS